MANLRPLAPFEKRLCLELGCTEEEYSQFLDEMQSQMARRPIPGDAIRCYPVMQIVQAVVGIIFQIVGLLLRPQPQQPRQARGPVGESASPVFGFNAVQELARIGDIIPQVYCDRTANPAGGVRVNGKLIWSQVESRGNYQQGKFLTVLSYGPIRAINPSATAVGQAPLATINNTATWVYYTGINNTVPLLQNSSTQYLQSNSQNQSADPTAAAGPIYWVPQGIGRRVPGTSQSYAPNSSNTFGISTVIPAENTIIVVIDRSDGSQTLTRRRVGISFDAATQNLIRNQGNLTASSIGIATFSLTVDRINLRDRRSGAGALQQELSQAVEAFAGGTRYILGNTAWRAQPFTPTANANPETGPVTLRFTLTDVFADGRISSETAIAPTTVNGNTPGFRQRGNRTLYPVFRYVCAAEFASYVSLSKVDALELSIKATVWGELSSQFRNDIRFNGNRNRISSFKVRFRRAGTSAYTNVKPLFYVDRSSKTPTFFYIRLEFPSKDNWEVQLYPVVDIPLQSFNGLFKVDINSPAVLIETDNSAVKCYANGISSPARTVDPEVVQQESELLAQLERLTTARSVFVDGRTIDLGTETNPFAPYRDLTIFQSTGVSTPNGFVFIDFTRTVANIDTRIASVISQIDAIELNSAIDNSFFQSANWRKPTPYRSEGDARYSFESGPEFSIIAVNEIQYDPQQNGYYRDLALLGLNIFGGSSRQDITQISAFVEQGRIINRYDRNNNGDLGVSSGVSNRFGDIFVNTLTDPNAGLGQYITSDMVDLNSIALANKFTDANGYYWDGVIDQEVAWRQWATENAGHNLLQVVTLNGKFGLVPVVPYNSQTGIIDPLAYTIKGLFNEGNILEGSYSESIQAAEDTLPQIVTVRYRENQFNAVNSDISLNAGFPRERSVTFKLKDEGVDTDRETVVNCAGDVTNVIQARTLATYLLCARRFEDRTITFKTPEPWLGLAPNDIIRVDTQFTRFVNNFAGRIKADGTYDIVGFDGNIPANSVVLVYTPGAGTGIQSFSGSTFNPASYPNSLVAIGQNTTESRLFTIIRIDIDEDGIAEISAKLFPVLPGDNQRPSLIATALLQPNNYVVQINSGG